jgi:hypothetical protein
MAQERGGLTWPIRVHIAKVANSRLARSRSAAAICCLSQAHLASCARSDGRRMDLQAAAMSLADPASLWWGGGARNEAPPAGSRRNVQSASAASGPVMTLHPIGGHEYNCLFQEGRLSSGCGLDGWPVEAQLRLRSLARQHLVEVAIGSHRAPGDLARFPGCLGRRIGWG